MNLSPHRGHDLRQTSQTGRTLDGYFEELHARFHQCLGNGDHVVVVMQSQDRHQASPTKVSVKVSRHHRNNDLDARYFVVTSASEPTHESPGIVSIRA